MNVEIRSVADKGNLEKERLVLRVVSKTDIGNYVLFRTGYHDDSVTTGVRNAFWFTYKAVSKGDLVIVYTKAGLDTEVTSENGTKSHFFYWGLKSPIWNEENRTVVVLHAPDWESKGPDEL